MKGKITLKIEADLLHKLPILAVEEGTLANALLAGRVKKAVLERKDYDRARRRALARLREGFNLGWKLPRSRDETHER